MLECCNAEAQCEDCPMKLWDEVTRILHPDMQSTLTSTDQLYNAIHKARNG